MGIFRNVVRQVPGMRWTYRKVYNLSLRMKSPEQVFTDIYVNNKWFGTDSVSGIGSDAVQTRVIVEALPRLFRRRDIRSVLDVPCGDFFWMGRIDLSGINYIGGDIVAELVKRNTANHARNDISFQCVDLVRDRLPKVDLVLVRDCLVHLAYEEALRALGNICQSGSKYLLSTTFPGRRNVDIPTGRWRPLDLQAAPFGLPTPLEIINEECTEGDGAFADKSLALWRVDSIERQLGAAE